MSSGTELVGDKQCRHNHRDRFREDRKQNEENRNGVPASPLVRSRGSACPQICEK